ncbi:DUF6602 domain-containing protein [Mycolicibacterium sp. CBM1]
MKLVSQYWRGVLRRLQAEVEDFNNIIGHQGEKGRENELSLARMLSNLVPSRYGIGSGLIFDSEGNESSQTDIILFDAVDEPTILAQTTQVLYPVENVYGCIEVKTSVGGAEIEDIGEKIDSVQALHSKKDGLALYAAVGYRATQTLETIAKHLQALKRTDGDLRPDLFLLVDPGMIGISGRVAKALGWEMPKDSDYLLGVTPLQAIGGGGIAAGVYEPVPAGAGTSAVLRGNTFSIHSIQGLEYLAESARALLLFSEALVTTLATEQGRPSPSFHHYISPEMRDIRIISLSQ